jgi:diguanylate cyclase (GGDEF)-like protein
MFLFLARFLLYRKPTESGLLWALVTSFLALQARGVIASAYFATAGLILVSSIIENTYFLAYHDELTTLPARRAFNDALFRLEAPYVVAVVDIDHFKSFNDTYGHETGDQVLRMVAAKLAGVTGGGQAYRVGGEEFSILFPGKSTKDALPHLELLRSVIEASTFRVRGEEERRNAARNHDGRSHERRSRDRRAEIRRLAAPRGKARSANFEQESGNHQISVTVSIGVAEPNAKTRAVEQVIHSADKALYRAKQGGRNRVDFGKPSRPSKPKRSIA